MATQGTGKGTGKQRSARGGITVDAVSNGRRITLDPLRAKQLPIEAREVESLLPCGFRQEWVSASTPQGDELFQLDVGAGCGSPWLTFRYGGRSFCIHVKDVADALMAFADETAEEAAAAAHTPEEE